MPKAKATEPNHLLKAWISAELKGRLYLQLHSEIEGRIPHGKISEFIEERLREFFSWRVLDLSVFGLPPGYFVKGPPEMLAELTKRLEGK